jgi:hypothetical protein
VTLTEFLLARIAEDEEDARSVHWEDAGIGSDDPIRSRWLAECEAKRRIVEGMTVTAEVEGGGYEIALRDALRALALPFADHPDYREEWRP